MKIAHWTLLNGSGMNRVAESISAAERALGLDSVVVNPSLPVDEYDKYLDVDIHVSHTHVRDEFRQRITKPYKVIWVSHGTPEHVFQSAVETGLQGNYGHSDGWMLAQHWMRTADAAVTFWPRHQKIWKSLCDKRTTVDCVPLGVDKTFWKPKAGVGKFVGKPSVFTAENCHYIKWPLDLFIAWPWIVEKLEGAPCLHASYLPPDMHRWFFPLVNSNDCSYTSFISNTAFSHAALVDVFSAVDFFVGLVRYGDFNRLSLEASSCGIKTISYTGNPYADFWVSEGDQRVLADELVKIFSGEVIPRKHDTVPDISETAKAMLQIYNRIAP